MTQHWIWIVSWLGIVCSAAVGALLVLRRQRARALGWALLIAAMSLAVGGAVLARFWPRSPDLWLITHIAAGLSLGWMLVCAALARLRRQAARRHDAVAILQFSALVCGMIAFIILIYVAVFEVLYRLVLLGVFDIVKGYALVLSQRPLTAAVGLADIAAVAMAAAIGLRITGQRSLGTLLFWLVLFGCVWAGLLIDPVEARRMGEQLVVESVPTNWHSWIALGMAVSLLVFVAADRLVVRRRRQRAWPARLGDLVTEPDPWPGFLVSAGLVSAAVLVIGTLLLTRPLTVPAAGIAGTTAFLLTARRWNANLAEIAMVLITVMAGSVAMLGAMPERWTSNDYPLLFQRALYALAIMTFIWHWLAGFWLQQLDDGRPWTTSGRMIPVARRVGFMVAAIGVLVALHLAAWPKMRLVTDPDRSLGSWIRGGIGIGLLLVAVTYATLQTRKPTLGWLSAIVAGTGVVFVLVRSSGSEGYLWFMRHGPLLLACAAPVIGALPILLRMRATNPYREMLTFGGGVFVPLVALAMLFMMEESQLAGRWLTAATLGVLAVWYAVLATRPVLRDALWFALALANLAAVDLLSQRGFSVRFVSVVTAILVAASGLCLVGVYWRALGRPVMRLLAVVAAGATGVLAAVAVTGFRGL